MKKYIAFDNWLKAYSLYKQATEGDCHDRKPNKMYKKKVKVYEMWCSRTGLATDVAARKFVKMVKGYEISLEKKGSAFVPIVRQQKEIEKKKEKVVGLGELTPQEVYQPPEHQYQPRFKPRKKKSEHKTPVRKESKEIENFFQQPVSKKKSSEKDRKKHKSLGEKFPPAPHESQISADLNFFLSREGRSERKQEGKGKVKPKESNDEFRDKMMASFRINQFLSFTAEGNDAENQVISNIRKPVGSTDLNKFLDFEPKQKDESDPW